MLVTSFVAYKPRRVAHMPRPYTNVYIIAYKQKATTIIRKKIQKIIDSLNL